MDRNKVLMIFGGAWLSALVLSWFLYSTTAGAKQTRLKTVLAAARDIPAGVRLRKTDLKRVSVPERDAPSGAVSDEKDLLEHALLFPVAQNELVTARKIASAAGVEGIHSIIPPGKRAVSVSVQDAASAAGLILPRSKVDVLVTRAGSLNEAVSNIILQDITVFSVGRVTELQSTGADPKGGTSTANATAAVTSTAARAVTLLVTPEESAKLELAKNVGRISLALRNPSDGSLVENPEPTTGEVIDPLMGDRRSKLMQMRARAGLKGPLPPGIDLRNDKEWAKLVAGELGQGKPAAPAKKEAPPPPKPRAVIDVYRGDKHVQETFPN
jgi:pilus assembly protein CpaB